MISAELTPFLESGISVLIGTRDARLVPECARVLGARVEEGGSEVTVFLPEALAGATLENLRDNGRVAACFSRPKDNRSIQIKGELVSIGPAGEDDRERVERYRLELAQVLGWVGLPPRLTLRIAHWPCHAIRFRVEALFVQTPGPGAGDPLAAPAADGRP